MFALPPWIRRAAMLVLSSVLPAIIAPAKSATLEAYRAATGQEVILLSGQITSGDAGSLMKLLDAAAQAGRPVPSLSLNSPGGLFLEGIRLAEIVRRFGLTTYVEEGASCASACFLVFVAGKEKLASYRARIGVHSAKDAAGDAGRAAAGTEAMGHLLRSLGVSDPIIKKMSITPHDRMAWLATPELQSINVKLLSFSDASPFEQVLSAALERGPHPSLSEPEKSWLWERLVRAASRLSVRQSDGRAQVTNVCPPDARSCTSAVTFTDGSGLPVLLRTTRDRSGRTTARQVCEPGPATGAPPCRPWARSE